MLVVAVDPPAGLHGDEYGIVVAGRSGSHGYVLADYSQGALTPAGWAARVMQAFADFEADMIVAESNQGGEMVKSVLHQADADAPVKLVHASRGKITRAQPAAALYETGRIHHAGTVRAAGRPDVPLRRQQGRQKAPTAWMRWSGRWPNCLKAGGPGPAFANCKDEGCLNSSAKRRSRKRAPRR